MHTFLGAEETEPAAGVIEGTAQDRSAVNILGDRLNGSSGVATVTVISPTEITVNMPAGATTGIVRVVTPAGR